jgi:polar amino acid transport system substrate-binding protein
VKRNSTLCRTLLMGGAMLLGSAGFKGAHAQGILQQVLSRGTLRVAVLGSLPPFSKVMPSGTPEGYDIDIANRLAGALHVKTEFVITDIPGRVTSLQTHKADVTIADFTRNVERSTTIAFSEPYLVTFRQLLVPTNSPFKSPDQLNDPKARIAIDRGGTAETEVPALFPKAQLVRFNSNSDELNAVLSGQADAMYEDSLYDQQAVKDHPGKLDVFPSQFNRAEIGIGLPPGDVDWLRLVNLYIEQFNATGANAVLFKKWFNVDIPKIQVAY